MKPEIEYLKVKFALGIIALVVGLIGASIALFKWIERTGVQYLLGNYSRYILGFGGFAAMIFGAMLINDAWVLADVKNGRYGLLTNYATTKVSGRIQAVKQASVVHGHSQIPTALPEYKKNIIRNVLKIGGTKEKRGKRPTRR